MNKQQEQFIPRTFLAVAREMQAPVLAEVEVLLTSIITYSKKKNIFCEIEFKFIFRNQCNFVLLHPIEAKEEEQTGSLRYNTYRRVLFYSI